MGTENVTKFNSFYFIYLLVLICMNLKLCVSLIDHHSNYDISAAISESNKITFNSNNHHNYSTTRNYRRNIKKIWEDIESLKHHNSINQREFNGNGHAVRHNQQKHHSYHEHRFKNYINSRYKNDPNTDFLVTKRIWNNQRIVTTTARTTTVPPPSDSDEYDYTDYGNDDANISPSKLSTTTTARVPMSNSNNGRASRETITHIQRQNQIQNQNGNGESLNDHKWKTLGERESVQKSFEKEITPERRQQHANNYKTRHHIRKLAYEHHTRVFKEAEKLCRFPKARIVRMERHPSIEYIPHLTILYRCENDHSCCAKETHVCTNKTSELVSLHFIKKSFLGRSTQMDPITIEMVNDTECHCVAKSMLNSSNNRHHHHHHSESSPSATATAMCSCNDPLLKFPKFENGKCFCTCRPTDHECKILLEGREGLSLATRQCIQNRNCDPPFCLHGQYNAETGRCPRSQHRYR